MEHIKFYSITHIDNNEFVIKSFSSEYEYSQALEYLKYLYSNGFDNVQVVKHCVYATHVESKIITPFTLI